MLITAKLGYGVVLKDCNSKDNKEKFKKLHDNNHKLFNEEQFSSPITLTFSGEFQENEVPILLIKDTVYYCTFYRIGCLDHLLLSSQNNFSNRLQYNKILKQYCDKLEVIFEDPKWLIFMSME